MSEEQGFEPWKPRHGAEAPKMVRCLLPFECAAGVYTGFPQRPFQPKGLVIWGAPERATVEQITIGCDYQAVVSSGPLPARWFALGDSYEQIAKLIDSGKEPPNWVDWTPIHLGQIARLYIRDGKGALFSMAQVVMWGLSPAV